MRRQKTLYRSTVRATEMSWLRKILRLTAGVRPRVVGTDLEGNQYLEVEARGMTIVTIIQLLVLRNYKVFSACACALGMGDCTST